MSATATPDATTAPGAASHRRSGPLNAGPALLLMALGLVLVAQAAVRARDASAGPGPLDQALYVGGLLLVVVPAALAALLPRIAAPTRVLLVMAMMVLLQLARLVVEPTRFVQPGELVTLNGLRVVEETDRLFGANPLAPGTSAYPGLQVAADAVRDLTGLGDHLSGVAVLVAARVLLALTLLLVVTRVSSSTRIGAAAVVVYALGPHLPVLGATFVAATLALPLAVLVGHLVLSRRHGSWLALAPAGVVLAAVVLTDQLTTLALVVVLALWAALEAVLRRGRGSAVPLAALAVAGAAGLAVSLALSGVGPASLLAADGSPVLFPGVLLDFGPAWERAAILAALLLTAVALVLGLLRRAPVVEPDEPLGEPEPVDSGRPSPAQEPPRPGEGRTAVTGRPLAVLLTGLALLFLLVPLGLLGLTSPTLTGRTTNLAYLGVAFVVAGWAWSARVRHIERRAGVLAAGAGVVFVGAGLLGAAPLADQLPGPFEPAAGARSVDPANLSAAEWMSRRLPDGSSVYADQVGGLLAAAVGGQDVVRRADGGVDASALLLDPDAGPDDLRLVRESGVRFLVADRRNADALPRQGFYVEPGEAGQDERTEPVPLEALRKFSAVPGVDLVYDNGSVVVYDLGGLDDD